MTQLLLPFPPPWQPLFSNIHKDDTEWHVIKERARVEQEVALNMDGAAWFYKFATGGFNLTLMKAQNVRIKEVSIGEWGVEAMIKVKGERNGKPVVCFIMERSTQFAIRELRLRCRQGQLKWKDDKYQMRKLDK